MNKQSMDITVTFHVHQPIRLKRFSVFMIGNYGQTDYFDYEKNRQIFLKVAYKCYLPTNKIVLDLLDNYDIKLAFSITGTFLEQAELFHPEVLESFKQLLSHKKVEVVSETYYHSLVSLFPNKEEFFDQVRMHKEVIRKLFKKSPVLFRNTEALYSNEIAELAHKMGYIGIYTEGWDPILGWRSPNYIYKPPNCDISVLLRNYRLSDDVSYRFSARWWNEWPLTADKYASWLAASEGQVINLYMDYETFGEHQWQETGIFEFLMHLPKEVLKYEHLNFSLPSEVVRKYKPVGIYDVPYPISWADMERDTSAWLGNDMQRVAFEELKKVYSFIKAIPDEEKREKFLRIWRYLSISDHLYYMCTKHWADGDVHKYFSHLATPYDAFINFMNVLQDLKEKIKPYLPSHLACHL